MRVAFPVRFQRRVFLVERVRDVPQEDEAEHHVLVPGRVHAVAELVRHLPQLRV